GTDPDGDALTFTKATDPAHGSVVVNADGTYTYTPAAGYTGPDSFTITISDGKGGTATVTVNITVNPRPNNPPTGTGDTKTTTRDVPVVGAVSGTDPDGDALTFTKDTDPAHGSVIVNTDGTYTYTPAAGYTGPDSFTILISDGRGGTAIVTVNITVNPPPNNPPTGTGDTKTTIQDTPVDGSVSGTDPDGDALTFTKATDPAHGSVVVNADGTYTYTPAAGYTGPDSFTITISDGKGGTTTVTVNITVNPRPNTPPTGTGDTKTTNQDTPVNGSVSGTDPDGDALTFTKDTDPAHGSVIVNTDGTYTYTPAAGYTGTDNFTIIISDGRGGTTTVTVNIIVNPVVPSNNPPTGTGDTKTTIQDTPVNGSVSGTDPDGDALTFTKATDPAHGSVLVNTDGTYTYTPAAGYTGPDSFTITISDGRGGTATVTVNITVNPRPNNPPTGTGDTKTTTQDIPVNGSVSGTDPDGDALTFTKATDPAHGSVVVNADGTYTYTPAAGYTGPDSFTITISDGKGGTTTVTVNITVNPRPNNPPTGTGDTKTTTQDTPVNGSVSGTDPDGDALTFTKDTDPAHGSVIVNADGTYTYTPAAGYTGPDSFTILISDGRGGTAIVTVNITVNPPPNNPPTGTGDTKTTIQDTPVNGSVSGTDPDGDALTFTKATDPAHGSVVVNADGTYTYTPAAGYTGPDSFTITISDGKGGTTTVTVNITVNPRPNTPPTGTGDTKTTNQDTPVNGSVSGTDPDGDALTFTKDTDPAHGSVIVNTDGTYTYTPTAGYTGTDNFTIIISDGRGGTTTVTVNIIVNPVVPSNNPPTGTGDTKTTIQDTPVNGSVSGADPDGDALTFTKATDPAHGSVLVNTDGTYTYTPAAGYTGPDSFTITISDGRGGTATVT
ncbi:Ig-like domain-containing protein, partial [Chitinophaga ginsengisoli]|uniref:Ig-like domain-containing protein n=1 Tax=Chitinophaga ginsengisoli TaxID=363837 RepID=UPI0011B283CF